MNTYIQLAGEKKNRKKAKVISVSLHLSVLLLALLPFMKILPSEEAPEMEVIFLEFSSGSQSSNSTASMTPKGIEDRPEVKPLEPMPMESEIQPMESEPIDDLVTVNNDEVMIEEPAEVEEEIVEQEIEEEIVETTDEPVFEEYEEEVIPEEIPEVSNDEVLSDVSDEANGEDTPGHSGASEMEGDGIGTAGDGQSDHGEAETGRGEGFIEGNGVLTRRIIYREDAKKLAEEDGVIILKVCINQRGSVIYIEYDNENSTISNKDLIDRAIDNVLKYRFERDYSAPLRECGRITYIFTLEG